MSLSLEAFEVFLIIECPGQTIPWIQLAASHPLLDAQYCLLEHNNWHKATLYTFLEFQNMNNEWHLFGIKAKEGYCLIPSRLINLGLWGVARMVKWFWHHYMLGKGTNVNLLVCPHWYSGSSICHGIEKVKLKFLFCQPVVCLPDFWVPAIHLIRTGCCSLSSLISQWLPKISDIRFAFALHYASMVTPVQKHVCFSLNLPPETGSNSLRLSLDSQPESMCQQVLQSSDFHRDWQQQCTELLPLWSRHQAPSRQTLTEQPG